MVCYHPILFFEIEFLNHVNVDTDSESETTYTDDEIEAFLATRQGSQLADGEIDNKPEHGEVKRESTALRSASVSVAPSEPFIPAESYLPPMSVILPGLVNSQPHRILAETSEASIRRCDLFPGDANAFIQLAQVLADQLAIRTADEYPMPGPDASKCSLRIFDDPLFDTIRRLFPGSEQCSLEAYAMIGEAAYGSASVAKAGARPPRKKQENSFYPLFRIPPPNLRVERGDMLLEMSSTGLQFWEELGLSPCSGSKAVIAFCVHPEANMIRRGVDTFLNAMSNAFLSLKLGTHSSGAGDISRYPLGKVPYSLDVDSVESMMTAIDHACEELGMFTEDIEGALLIDTLMQVNLCPR